MWLAGRYLRYITWSLDGLKLDSPSLYRAFALYTPLFGYHSALGNGESYETQLRNLKKKVLNICFLAGCFLGLLFNSEDGTDLLL
jgi:hypothetical protein